MIVFTPVWERPQITEIYCLGVKRLGLEAFCIVSPEDTSNNKEIILDYGFEVFEYPNNPLGRKKNEGLKEVLKKDFDYLIELNSDDVARNEILEVYEPLTAARCPFFGLSEFLVYDTTSGNYSLNQSSTLYGIGRCYSKEALTGKVLWPDSWNKGMDNSSENVMRGHKIEPTTVKWKKPLAVDLKSETNIWSFESMVNRRGNIEYNGDPLEGLSKAEKDKIHALKKED